MRGRQVRLRRSERGNHKAYLMRKIEDVFTGYFSPLRKTIAFLFLPSFHLFLFPFQLLEHFNFCVVADLRTLNVHNLKIQLKYGCRNSCPKTPKTLNPRRSMTLKLKTDTPHTAKTVQLETVFSGESTMCFTVKFNSTYA